MENLLLKRVVKDLKGLEGIEAVTITSPDGVTCATSLNGEAESMGSVFFLLKTTAEEIASSLNMGTVGEILLESSGTRILVKPWADYLLCISLGERASPQLLTDRITPLLEGIE